MERKPQTCDNPDGHRLEEGEGTKDLVVQNNHGILPQVMFPFAKPMVSYKVLEGYSDASFGAKKGTKEHAYC